MSNAFQILLVVGKGYEVLHGVLTYEHGTMPMLSFGPNEKWTTFPVEDEFATALAKEGQGVFYVAGVGFRATDFGLWSNIGEARVVRNRSKSKQIQHKYRSLKATLHQRKAGGESWFQVAFHPDFILLHWDRLHPEDVPTQAKLA